MDLSHLTQLPPAFMNETQKTVGLKAWMTCLSVEQVIYFAKSIRVSGTRTSGIPHLDSVLNQMVFKLFSNREFNCHNHLSSCWKGPWLNHSYRLYTGCIILYDSYRMSHTVWLILESPYWEFQLIIFFSWGWPKVWKQTFRKSVLSIQVSHIDFDLSTNQISGYHKL